MKLGGKADACFFESTIKRRLAIFINQRVVLLTFGECIWVRNVHRLHGGHDLLSVNLAVRLNDVQSQWSRPHDGSHLFLAPARGGTLPLLGTGARTGTLLVVKFHSLMDTITWHRFRNDACGGSQPVHDIIRPLL